MKKVLVSALAITAALVVSNCKSTNKYKVGSQEVIMHDRMSITFFGSPSTHIDDCMKEAGEAGATELIAAAGKSCYGIFGLTCSSESTQTTDTPACSAYGTMTAGAAPAAPKAAAPAAEPAKPAAAPAKKGKK